MKGCQKTLGPIKTKGPQKVLTGKAIVSTAKEYDKVVSKHDSASENTKKLDDLNEEIVENIS